MSDKRHYLDDALDAAVEGFDGALPSRRARMRSVVERTTDDFGRRTAFAVIDIGQVDGSGRIYEIDIAVSERVDHRDRYWGERVPNDFPIGQQVVVDSEFYVIGDGKGAMRGYGGRAFEIEFFDGRRITTRDLWHGGTVPPRWRDTYPDNARFVPQSVLAQNSLIDRLLGVHSTLAGEGER